MRPLLSNTLTPETFKCYYWEKRELVAFCVQHKIPSHGGKLAIADRIEYFLATGTVEPSSKTKRILEFDSDRSITLTSRVINFKCDANTRKFFIQHIGNHFKFNNYLREFAKTPNLDGNLSYGALVKGWLENEAIKNNSKQKPAISKQFQFNQFQRDFYNANKKAKREEMLDAWKLVRSVAGQATYEHYLQLMKK